MSSASCNTTLPSLALLGRRPVAKSLKLSCHRMLKQDAATVHSEGPKRVIRDRFMFYLLCPLWVKSRHVQRESACLLSAISGHQADIEFTRPVGAPSLEYLRGEVVRVEPDNVQNRSPVIPCAIHMGSNGNDGVDAVTVGRLSTEV